MPHKITITGLPTSELRKRNNNTYSFDMEEKGSSNAPKGLPLSSTITYTVFVSKKSIDKANININNFKNTKLLIQGEPTLDLPIDECPGEIGVVCFQLSEIEQKERKEETVKIEDNNTSTTKDNVENKNNINIPDLSKCDYVYLNDILIPDKLDEPNSKKLEKAINFLKETGSLEMAVEIIYDNGQLFVTNNRYVHFLAAKEVGLEKVPVKVIVSKKYKPENTNKYILLEKIIIPEEFLAARPNPHKLTSIGTYFQKRGMVDKPITVDKETLILKDGYSRYVYLQDNNILYAPVRWE